jgi:hypothetical protein
MPLDAARLAREGGQAGSGEAEERDFSPCRTGRFGGEADVYHNPHEIGSGQIEGNEARLQIRARRPER